VVGHRRKLLLSWRKILFTLKIPHHRPQEGLLSKNRLLDSLARRARGERFFDGRNELILLQL
jgi:hypothetical protein